MSNHTETTIKDVKQGNVFRLKINGPVYVRGSYDQSSKKFEAYKWDDINHFIYKRGDFPVFIGFDF